MLNAPGKRCRKLTLPEIIAVLPDQDKARDWISLQRWPDGPCCPHRHTDSVQCGINLPAMTHGCQVCPGRPMFSVKSGSVMEGFRLRYRHWAVGIPPFRTNIREVSSMRIHPEPDIGRKLA